jgi:hypothetical protein
MPLYDVTLKWHLLRIFSFEFNFIDALISVLSSESMTPLVLRSCNKESPVTSALPVAMVEHPVNKQEPKRRASAAPVFL